jgi:hypothetical protein
MDSGGSGIRGKFAGANPRRDFAGEIRKLCRYYKVRYFRYLSRVDAEIK